MATIKIATTQAKDVTANTLKLAPTRLLTFLQGVADPAIGAQLARFGWSEARLEGAWSLLNELKATSVVPPPPPPPNRIAEAIAACEAWQATCVVRARAILPLTHSEQALFLWHDFETGSGTAAVLNAATFLKRRQALDKGVARKDTRKADHEALVIIEETGTTKEMLKDLQAWVDAVQSFVPAAPVDAPDVDPKRIETLRKIHAWITAWTDVARTVVTRRDHLIRLGIAKRRVSKDKSIASPRPAVDPNVDEPPASQAA